MRAWDECTIPGAAIPSGDGGRGGQRGGEGFGSRSREVTRRHEERRVPSLLREPSSLRAPNALRATRQGYAGARREEVTAADSGNADCPAGIGLNGGCGEYGCDPRCLNPWLEEVTAAD